MKTIILTILKRVGSVLLMEILQKSIEELEKRQDNTIGQQEVLAVKALEKHLK